MVHVGRNRLRRSRRMIRKAIRDEKQATRDYERLEQVVSAKQRKVIKHIKREEQEHRKELSKLVK